MGKINRYESPDGLISPIGGQPGLNLGMQLSKKGILEECQVELLGTSFDAIDRAEDRELFKELCLEIGEPIIESEIATSLEEVIEAAKKAIKDNVNPRKWICVEASNVIVKSKGDLVILIMADTEMTSAEEAIAPKLEANFDNL